MPDSISLENTSTGKHHPSGDTVKVSTEGESAPICLLQFQPPIHASSNETAPPPAKDGSVAKLNLMHELGTCAALYVKSRMLPVKIPADISSPLVGLSGFIKTDWQAARTAAYREMRDVHLRQLDRGLQPNPNWLESGIRSTETWQGRSLNDKYVHFPKLEERQIRDRYLCLTYPQSIKEVDGQLTCRSLRRTNRPEPPLVDINIGGGRIPELRVSHAPRELGSELESWNRLAKKHNSTLCELRAKQFVSETAAFAIGMVANHSIDRLIFPDTPVSIRSALLDTGGGALMLLPGKAVIKAAATVGVYLGARMWDLFDSRKAQCNLLTLNPSKAEPVWLR